MANFTIQIIDELPKEIEDKMQVDLVAYEASHKLSKTFFVKFFEDELQIQGILPEKGTANAN